LPDGKTGKLVGTRARLAALAYAAAYTVNPLDSFAGSLSRSLQVSEEGFVERNADRVASARPAFATASPRPRRDLPGR